MAHNSRRIYSEQSPLSKLVIFLRTQQALEPLHDRLQGSDDALLVENQRDTDTIRFYDCQGAPTTRLGGKER
jgi:hypothetical protein